MSDNCPSCGKPVASNANVCPHCGHQFGAGLNQIAGIFAVAVLVVMVALKGCG